MSRLFPHSAYAEDQPFAQTLLTYHVLHRGLQSGAVVGLSIGVVRSLIRHTPLATAALRSTGYGAIIGTALMVPGLAGQMAGKTEIEWKDRSWRLLENEGQKEVDDWSNAGFVAGVLAIVRSDALRQLKKGRWVKLVGGAAMGNLLGVTGYMIWRYGFHGGRRAQEEHPDKGVTSQPAMI
ncbi:hypothetical protein LTR37_004535 [Vermiconidia calcicola]|uniref:Uncharacterized protein n=1 Tax=Vermiconidia calcicola TaxID=1690605 RepID=A0ACC3NPV5_9PEZI|nr:hypothetical protein LTR37_004535 [Vermiconidia calcicola]